MRAAWARDGKLVVDEKTAKPTAKYGQVLIRVEYFGINRADTLQRRGLYPPPAGASPIPGLECTGVVAKDSDTKAFRKGERVMALLSGGGYAEYVAAEEAQVMRVPSQMSSRDAACVPEQWLTGYQLLRIARVGAGDRVLIHAGGSGVGTALVQMCACVGAYPIVTAGSKTKIDRARALGAVFGANYKTENFAEKVVAFVNEDSKARGVPSPGGVDVILDCVGASHAAKNIACIRRDGRWVLYGLMGGRALKDFNLGAILGKRIALTGTTLRTRSNLYKAQLVKGFSKEILPHFGDGKVKVVFAKEFALSDVQASHDYMEANKNFGKIVVRVA